eukprot:PhM_4_TR13310/c0_g2_i1/m.21037
MTDQKDKDNEDLKDLPQISSDVLFEYASTLKQGDTITVKWSYWPITSRSKLHTWTGKVTSEADGTRYAGVTFVEAALEMSFLQTVRKVRDGWFTGMWMWPPPRFLRTRLRHRASGD